MPPYLFLYAGQVSFLQSQSVEGALASQNTCMQTVHFILKMHWFVLLNWLSEIRDAVLAVTERESSSHSSETEYFLQNVGNAKEAYLKKKKCINLSTFLESGFVFLKQLMHHCVQKTTD